MIPIVKEPEEYYNQFHTYEKCYFCTVPTNTWHWRTNQPVCKDCAKTHKVENIEKCTPDYKPLTRKQYLNQC